MTIELSIGVALPFADINMVGHFSNWTVMAIHTNVHLIHIITIVLSVAVAPKSAACVSWQPTA